SSMSFGSGSAQSSRRFAGTQGQLSPQPMVTTASNSPLPLPGTTSSSDFDAWVVRSYPSSAMKRIAFGLIRPDGREPALNASTSAPPCMRANASAIWLRLAFSTQTNNTRFIAASSAARRLRPAARGAIAHLRPDAGDVRAAGRAVGRARSPGRVVLRGLAGGVEGFPTRALGIGGPQLVGLRVAADRRFLRHHRAAGCVQACAQRRERLAALGLDAQVVDARRAPGIGDGEV